MGKNKVIIIITLSIITLLSSIISTLVIINNENARTELNSNKAIATNNTFISSSIVYKEANTFTIKNLKPGETITKTFTITNNNSKETKYDVYWTEITSNWGTANMYGIIHPEEFVYSLNCINGEKTPNKQMPINENETIIEGITLDTNKTNTCTLRITFIQKEEDQSYNLEKTFTGTYSVKLIK